MRVIVLVLNRARPDFIGAYGAEAVATPNLDQLAAEGVVFDQHFAERPSVAGSRRAWNTGCLSAPATLRAPMNLAERLWQAKVRSILVGSEQCPSRRLPFGQGWETSLWLRRNRLAELNQPTMVDGTLQLAIDWLEHQGNQDNWCMWVEVGALRPPWDVNEYADAPAADELEADDPEVRATDLVKDAEQMAAARGDPEEDAIDAEPDFDFRPGLVRDSEKARDRLRGYQQAYGGIMTYVDDLLGQFATLLKELKLYDEVLLLVTGDVGLPLGEHGLVGDSRPWLHEELIHLPLIIRLPGGAGAGRRVQQLTQPLDLPATLADFLKFDWNPACGQGLSWRPILEGKRGKLRDYVCARLHKHGQEEWSIRTHHWHLILPIENEECTRKRQLYIKPDDRWEVNNLAEQRAETADHLELVLRRYMATAWNDPLVAPPPLNEELLQISH